MCQIYEISGGEFGEVFCSDSCADAYLDETQGESENRDIKEINDENYIADLKIAGDIRCEFCGSLIFGEEND